ncbi:MAG: phosphoenolpyruvate synthase [Thermoplasmata archaeon]|nr:MAG: phosphoenolpyruvate synthase [Thermoplasmata archaeon]
MVESVHDVHDHDIDYDGDYKPVFHDFYDLMKWRVSRILLVSSLYDAFTLEEEGILFEQISSEYRDLALPFPPQVIRVSTAKRALKELEKTPYDLIITMARLPDMDPFEFGRKAKEVQKDVSVIMLLTDAGDIQLFHKPGVHNGIDKIFFWNGDSALFVAIVKYIEDQKNLERDLSSGLVRIILVVENDPRYYSIFLPLVFTVIVRQTRNLIHEGLNEQEKMLRKRARPKIALAETYEDAMEIYSTYKDKILGIISDVSYPKNGRRFPDAGFHLAKEVGADVPIILQSNQLEKAKKAEEMGIPFIYKNSETLLQEIRDWFQGKLGFGPFKFRRPGGELIAEAGDLKEFMEVIDEVPAESMNFHGSTNDFSNWFFARGEIDLATRLKEKKVSDFSSGETMKRFLIEQIKNSQRRKLQGVIINFGNQTFEFEGTITRLGGGSLGGKGRGIAFLSSLLHQSKIETIFRDCRIKVPDTLILGTDIFTTFMERNELNAVSVEGLSDEEIKELFLSGSIDGETMESLALYLGHIDHPIAVRSSSLLEDSQNQPFAGIYATYLLPNKCGDDDKRLKELTDAIKLVYASAFLKEARSYIQSTVHVQEEEKMAVVIQKLVGKQYGNRFYPLLSGLAQSINFYPVHPLKREDGISSVALGLGKIVVEGEKVMSFSPEHPNVIPGFSSVDDILSNSQTHFYALDMSCTCYDLREGEDSTLLKINVSDAEQDGVLDYLASTYDANDNIIRDGTGRPGPRVITFAGILKYDMLPLDRILKAVLQIGKRGMGRPVEIEFAATLNERGEKEFHLLQIRPLVTLKERALVRMGKKEEEGALITSNSALGNGVIYGLRDILLVVPDRFDNTMTETIAEEIGRLNGKLKDRPYVLIGPGRWGTRDRFLGIPVRWDQISGARAIVEVQTKDFRVDPSHGTHFFHNLIARGMPYFTVQYSKRADRINWKELLSMKAAFEGRFVRHIRTEEPFLVKVDGRSGRGLVRRDDAGE